MSTQTNNTAGLIAAAIFGAALVITGTVWAMRDAPHQSGADVSAPGVKVDTRGSDVNIDAPFTSIQKDSRGTRIQAPGVDIELPPKPAE